MVEVFLWFYCLPIEDAVILILLGTAVYSGLRRKFQQTQYWKAGIAILLLFWTAVILFGTVGHRTEGTGLMEPILKPLYSYYLAFNGGSRELLRESFMNVVLFYPAGLLGCEVLPKGWNPAAKIAFIAILFALLSIGIESCQYLFVLGLAETDDVLHNTFGAVLGALVSRISAK